MVRPAVGTGEQKWGIAGVVVLHVTWVLLGFIRAQPGGK